MENDVRKHPQLQRSPRILSQLLHFQTSPPRAHRPCVVRCKHFRANFNIRMVAGDDISAARLSGIQSRAWGKRNALIGVCIVRVG